MKYATFKTAKIYLILKISIADSFEKTKSKKYWTINIQNQTMFFCIIFLIRLRAMR